MKLDNYNNLLELFLYQYRKKKSEEVFLTSLKNKEINFTWKQTFECIQKLSNKIAQNIKPKDRCLLISENRPEWLISDLSIMLAGGITVPAYTTYAERDYEYLINDCKPSIIIVSDNAQFQKVKNLISKKNFIKLVVSFENIKDDSVDVLNIEKVFSEQNYVEKNLEKLNIKRSNIACIIYTSGTQGDPKGVILSHGGILSNCEGSTELLNEIINHQPKFLTWLPLSHSYEHTVQFVQIAVGAKIYYAESIDKLIKNMKDCSPEVMTAVPDFIKIYIKKYHQILIKPQELKSF